MYDSTKWKVMAIDYDTTSSCNHSGCTMHRWQWALFESVDIPEYKVILFNLHGPHAGLFHEAAVKTAFFQDVNAQIKKLEAQYASIPIFVTGDFNANPQDAETAGILATMTNGTTLVNTRDSITNSEPSSSGNIDHIYMTNGDATVLQNRSVYNLTAVRPSSDHAPVFIDAQLKRVFVAMNGSSMGWGEGVPIS